MSEPLLLAAEFVFPVASPPVARGAVVIDAGTIAAVGPRDELERSHRGARVLTLDGCILTPGLVNAHCHLELGYLRGKIPPCHFVEWVIHLMRQVRSQTDLETLVAASVRTGVAELLSGGVTTVGDIAKQVLPARSALRDGPIHATSFGEIQAIGSRRGTLAERIALVTDTMLASPTMRIGISPHAPYTVEGPSLRASMAAAGEGSLPVCMHLSELEEEPEFLASLSGKIREPWKVFGTEDVLDGQIPRHPGGPIRWARDFGLFPAAVPVILAHVNYATDDELDLLAQAANVSVAYCPRTRSFFGHDLRGPHRFHAMLERGINVCLATDSLASTPDLLLLREAQHVLRLFPQTPPGLILEMLTVRAARALQGAGQTTAGTLSVGAPADVAAFPLSARTFTSADDSLADVLTNAPPARAVWVEGKSSL